jgi:hypothetical protein
VVLVEELALVLEPSIVWTFRAGARFGIEVYQDLEWILVGIVKKGDHDALFTRSRFSHDII